MPTFTTALSLIRPLGSALFYCTYLYNSSRRRIQFVNDSDAPPPTGKFRKDRGGTINLPAATFDILGRHLNVGTPIVTIETTPQDDVTKFEPGTLPSITLSLGSLSPLRCLYEFADPSTGALSWCCLEFNSASAPPPIGPFALGTNCNLLLPPNLMAEFTANLSPPPGEQTMIAVETDLAGTVLGFKSWTQERETPPAPMALTNFRESNRRSTRDTESLVRHNGVILLEQKKTTNDFYIRGLVDRRADLRRFIEMTIINTGDRRARTRGKFALGNDEAYCRLSRKRFGRVRELLSRAHKNVALSVVVNSSGTIVDIRPGPS